MVPISMYFKNERVKIEFALARGKKKWDKRETIMKKDYVVFAKNSGLKS